MRNDKKNRITSLGLNLMSALSNKQWHLCLTQSCWNSFSITDEIWNLMINDSSRSKSFHRWYKILPHGNTSTFQFKVLWSTLAPLQPIFAEKSLPSYTEFNQTFSMSIACLVSGNITWPEPSQQSTWNMGFRWTNSHPDFYCKVQHRIRLRAASSGQLPDSFSRLRC